MLHVGLDLSRRRVDVCVLAGRGRSLGAFRSPVDRDGLYGLSRRLAIYGEPVRAVVESINGARYLHDELVGHGWDVLVADAQRVKGLAPLACKTDKVDARVLAELSWRDLVPAIWLPGAFPLAAASGQASHDAEEPRAFDIDRVRASDTGLGPVRPPAAGGCSQS
jgi:transposase